MMARAVPSGQTVLGTVVAPVNAITIVSVAGGLIQQFMTVTPPATLYSR